MTTTPTITVPPHAQAQTPTEHPTLESIAAKFPKDGHVWPTADTANQTTTQTLLHTGPDPVTVTLPHIGTNATAEELATIDAMLRTEVTTRADVSFGDNRLGTYAAIFPEPIRTTRLKMTLNCVEPLPGDADNPLTRCTYGAVYSQVKTEEDYVFGKYTPYASMQYNVRSDIAEHLVVGKAYYIDIHAVPE